MKYLTKAIEFEGRKVIEVGATVSHPGDPHNPTFAHPLNGKQNVQLEYEVIKPRPGASEEYLVRVAAENQARATAAQLWMDAGLAKAGDVVTSEGLLISAALIEFLCK